MWAVYVIIILVRGGGRGIGEGEGEGEGNWENTLSASQCDNLHSGSQASSPPSCETWPT